MRRAPAFDSSCSWFVRKSKSCSVATVADVIGTGLEVVFAHQAIERYAPGRAKPWGFTAGSIGRGAAAVRRLPPVPRLRSRRGISAERGCGCAGGDRRGEGARSPRGTGGDGGALVWDD